MTLAKPFLKVTQHRDRSVTEAVKWKYMNRDRERGKKHTDKAMNEDIGEGMVWPQDVGDF